MPLAFLLSEIAGCTFVYAFSPSRKSAAHSVIHRRSVGTGERERMQQKIPQAVRVRTTCFLYKLRIIW